MLPTAERINLGIQRTLEEQILPDLASPYPKFLAPDLVISGINRGPNLGRDTLYSATVAAAMEAAVFGVSSISASLASYDYPDYSDAAAFLKRFIREYGDLLSEMRGTLNINFPGCPATEWGGVLACRLDAGVTVSSYEIFKLGGMIWYMAVESDRRSSATDTDYALCAKGFVTITPLSLDFFDTHALDELSRGL